MNSMEFERGYSRLESYFNTKPNDSRSEVWFSKLRTYDAYTWDRVIDQIIEDERYFPTLGTVKAMCWKVSPKAGDAESKEVVLSDAEVAFSRDFMPLFMGYLRGKTDKTELAIQMCFFATKHGIHQKMWNDEPCRHCGQGGN